MTPEVPVANGPSRSIRGAPEFHSGQRLTSRRISKISSAVAAESTLCVEVHIGFAAPME
jgi:hypothetical protein